MLLNLMLFAFVGMLGMWLLVLAVIPVNIRLWLAMHPLAFLLIHIPFMFIMTSIGGEGIVFGVANLLAGIVAQIMLAYWGVRKHGLSITGKRTPQYYRLHPPKEVKQALETLAKYQQQKGGS